MKTAIYCKPTAKGVHSFYLVKGNDEIFLFSQPYRKGVADYFGQGLYYQMHSDIQKPTRMQRY